MEDAARRVPEALNPTAHHSASPLRPASRYLSSQMKSSETLIPLRTAIVRGASSPCSSASTARSRIAVNFGRPTYAPGGLKALLHRWLGVCRTWTEQLARIDTLRVAFVLGLELSEVERSRVTAELDSREVRRSFNRGPFEFKQLDELAPLRSDQDIVEFLGRSQSVDLSEQAAGRVAESIYRASLLPGQTSLASYRQCVDGLNRGRAHGWDQLLSELGVPPAEHDDW